MAWPTTRTERTRRFCGRAATPKACSVVVTPTRQSYDLSSRVRTMTELAVVRVGWCVYSLHAPPLFYPEERRPHARTQTMRAAQQRGISGSAPRFCPVFHVSSSALVSHALANDGWSNDDDDDGAWVMSLIADASAWSVDRFSSARPPLASASLCRNPD